MSYDSNVINPCLCTLIQLFERVLPIVSICAVLSGQWTMAERAVKRVRTDEQAILPATLENV
jgi:hypothetical protein